MSLFKVETKANAEIYHGDEICQKKLKFFLKEAGFPNGLLPLKDIEECGYVKETGFVWLKQKKKREHKFENSGMLVSFAPEVAAYVELGKIKKLTGVKCRELFVWVTVSDFYVDNPPSEKITFKSTIGLSRTYPVTTFEIEEDQDNKEIKVVEI